MASFVNVIVTDPEGRTLERWYTRSQKWGLPGASLAARESPEEAARRALLDRTGYAAPVDVFVAQPRQEAEGVEQYVFTCPFDAITLVDKPQGDDAQIRWHEKDAE
jgi:ADP-ribose pyrophosphatase YjhB (NUDIX family)